MPLSYLKVKNWKNWNGKFYDRNNVYVLKNGKGFIKRCGYDGKLEFEGCYINGQINWFVKEYE